MSDRARRVGENEAVFREVNERIEGLDRTFARLKTTLKVVCECGDLGCLDRFELDIDDYAAVRADPALFILMPGHEAPDVEDVLERRDGYVVIRKRPGEPQRIAEQTDPRR